MTVACVCELCNCGRHHCPARKSQPISVPFNGESSYHTDYREHPLQKATIRTANKLPSAPVKFEGESSYRVEYKPMPPPEKKPVERNYLRQPVKIPFEATSSYNADFVKHPLNGRARAMEGRTAKMVSVPFTGTTTHRDTYTPKYRPVAPPEPRRTQMVRQSLPHDWTTTNKHDYVPHEIIRERRVAASDWKPPPGTFEGTTEQRDKFKHPGICPVFSLPQIPNKERTTAHVFYDTTMRAWAS